MEKLDKIDQQCENIVEIFHHNICIICIIGGFDEPHAQIKIVMVAIGDKTNTL